MIISNWLQLLARRMWCLGLRALRPGGNATGRTARRRPAGLTLAAERLEERVLLSAYTVTNLNDSGAGSLRQAVINANGHAGADSIVFQAGLSGTILLTGGQMAVTGDLSITGRGQASTIIDGNHSDRLFDVSGAGTDFTIEDLTLQNGQIDGPGGAIVSTATGASTIRITNSMLSGNSTSGLFYGGGAICAVNSHVTVTNSTLSGNSTAESYSQGGAIYARNGNVTVTDSTLNGNSTAGFFSEGGAIFTHSGNLIITSSTLSGNSTAGGSAHGGAICAEFSNVTVTNSTLVGNSTAAGFAIGGAIASQSAGNLTIVNSTLSGNHVDGSTQFGGGAIYFEDGDLTIINSTITANSADIGGGIGVHADNGGESLTIHNSIVAGNTATTNPDFTAPGNAFTNLRVANSLIGRRDGTTLTADATATFTDAKQTRSYVGGVTVGAAINPNLGPLQENGGPTMTHSLLAGSKAINHGSNALAVDPTNGNAPLTNDQRGVPFYRIVGGTVDMGAFEYQPLLIHGDTAFLYGTSTADDIIVRLALGQVEVNGVAWVLPDNITDVQINALQGTDRLTVYGTAGDEVIRLFKGSALLDSTPSGVTGRALSVETITCYSVGGNDQATLNGSTGGDVLVTSPTNTTFSGTGFSQRLSGYTDIRGYGKGGADRATLNGSSGVDVFTTQTTYATLSGAGYSARANDFDRVIGSGRGGSSDQANFNGSGAADTFVATAAVASLTVPGYFFQGYDFDVRVANGRGGTDTAKLYGTAGSDTFSGFGTFGQLLGAGFTDRVLLFEDVRIIGYGGVNTLSLSTTNPIQYVLKKFGVWV